jgi:hypothetical protein
MISLSDKGFALCSREELRLSASGIKQNAGEPEAQAPESWTEHRMDRSQALDLLRRSQSDIWAQASLRRLLANGLPPTALSKLSDDQIAEAIVDMVASGKLVLARSQDYSPSLEGEALAAAPKLQTAAAPPPSRPAPRPASSPPPPPADPPVFPSNINAAAQAAASQQAAQQGAPFCLQ